MTLRYDKMRIGEYLATQSRKQIVFEKGLKTAFESCRRAVSKQHSVADDHAPEVRLLSDVSRLYMEHYHFIQQSRRRETVDFVGRSKKLVDEVLNAIEKQNYCIYDETEQREETAAVGSDFIDIDAVSEIVFDKLDATQQFESQITVNKSLSIPVLFRRAAAAFLLEERTRLLVFVTMKRPVCARRGEGGGVRHFFRRWHSTRRRCEHDCHETTMMGHFRCA